MVNQDVNIFTEDLSIISNFVSKSDFYKRAY